MVRDSLAKTILPVNLQVIQGLDWVRQHYAPPAVVVMALGGDSQYALDMAVRNLALAGVPVVVAAGNEDTDACAKSPARSALGLTQRTLLALAHTFAPSDCWLITTEIAQLGSERHC